MTLERCAVWLERDKDSTHRSDVSKMINVIERLPVGWSISDEGSQWRIYDEEGDFICSAESADQLNRFLNIEFALAQACASMALSIKYTTPAEA